MIPHRIAVIAHRIAVIAHQSAVMASHIAVNRHLDLVWTQEKQVLDGKDHVRSRHRGAAADTAVNSN